MLLALTRVAQWPLPLSEERSQIVFEEWVKLDSSFTKAQLAMAVAKLFYKFVEVRAFCFSLPAPRSRPHQQHRSSELAGYENYPWLLRRDAFYRVWLLGLERIENNLFVADLKYAKYYPNE